MTHFEASIFSEMIRSVHHDPSHESLSSSPGSSCHCGQTRVSFEVCHRDGRRRRGRGAAVTVCRQARRQAAGAPLAPRLRRDSESVRRVTVRVTVTVSPPASPGHRDGQAAGRPGRGRRAFK